MTDSQLLTLAMAVILPLSMLIYSNSRITEAKETLRAEMAAMKAELTGQLLLINNKLDHLLEIVTKHEEKFGGR
jgi:hypothetical protein